MNDSPLQLTTAPSERPTLESVSGVFLPLECAASWIAFETFSRRYLDWPMRLWAILDDTRVDESIATNDGRYFAAIEMLHKAIGRELISAYGRYYEPEPDEEADSRLGDVLADGRTRKILPEEARLSFHFLDEDHWVIGGQIYDMVLINWHDLLRVFGPLSQEFGSQYLNEARPQLQSPPDAAPGETVSIRRGRPAKWNWEQINLEIILLANQPNGLPETQAELENWVARKCQLLFGDEPGMSTIRSRVGPIYQRLRSKGQ